MSPARKRTSFVVAVTKKEAEMLADEFGHRHREDAEDQLHAVKASADPYYGQRYRIFEVSR